MKKEIAIQLIDEQYIPEELIGPRNAKTTLLLLADPTLTTVGNYAGSPIFLVTDGPLSGRYFVVEDNLIKYYVKYRSYNFVPLNSLCQVGVWRDEDFAPSERDEGPTMAAHVFQTILLKRYGEIISDNMQTKFGRYFWLRQIQWALSHNKKVYFLKLSGEEIGKILDIVSIKDIDHWKLFKDESWGKTLKDQRIRLLITEKPVFFPNKDEFKRQKKNIGIK